MRHNFNLPISHAVVGGLVAGSTAPLSSRLQHQLAGLSFYVHVHSIGSVAALVFDASERFDQVGIIAIVGTSVGCFILLCIAVAFAVRASRLSSRLSKSTAIIEAQKNRLSEYDSFQLEQELKKPLPAQIAATYAHPDDSSRFVVLVQGAIGDILGFVRPDVIVNSENDFLMLGRPFDKNFSGTLRNLDGVKDQGKRIVHDSLEINLREKLGNQPLPVSVGSVFDTKTTTLSGQGVKFILHVVTVQPHPQGGYYTDPKLIPVFVQSCFDKISDLLILDADIDTVLFPLIGAGDGGVSPVASADYLIPAIVKQMARYKGMRVAYIVAFRGVDLQALEATAARSGLVSAATNVQS